MELVEFDKLPKLEDIQDVPLDNLAKIFKICQEMEALCERENGIGLSAVQVGIPLKLFIIKSDGSCPLIDKGEYGYFVNTNYKATDKEQIVSLEGCLSIRSQDGQLRFFQLDRQNKVHIHGQKLYKKELLLRDVDMIISAAEQGVVFQHEIDHHHALLISDIGEEVYIW